MNKIKLQKGNFPFWFPSCICNGSGWPTTAGGINEANHPLDSGLTPHTRWAFFKCKLLGSIKDKLHQF